MKQPRWNVPVKVRVVAVLCVLLLASCGGDSPESQVKSAKDYLAKGDSSAAVIQLRNALQKAPNNAEARYVLGTILIERRDPAGAVKELRKALELGYPPEQTLPALARAMINDGDTKELVTEFGDAKLAVLDKAVEAKPDYLPARYELVSLLIAKGDLDLASTQVGAIRKVSKQDTRAYYFDALIASQRGNLPAAREAIQQALKASP